MAAEKEDFLRRWSRLKKETPAEKPVETPKPELPSIDKLTPESDFSAFMHPKVEDALRRVALKKLFRGDPHFNLPDPFEPNSRDWNIADPIPEEMLKTLNQARTLLFSDEEKRELEKQEAAAAAQAQAPAPDSEAPPSKPDEPGKRDA
ncbi:MAG TPA: DUF3306 domain-containing protein [Burkholderiales bacterium]|nr:DUF3306 domain-containing protein [Burkholderiales bacterium]